MVTFILILFGCVVVAMRVWIGSHVLVTVPSWLVHWALCISLMLIWLVAKALAFWHVVLAPRLWTISRISNHLLSANRKLESKLEIGEKFCDLQTRFLALRSKFVRLTMTSLHWPSQCKIQSVFIFILQQQCKHAEHTSHVSTVTVAFYYRILIDQVLNINYGVSPQGQRMCTKKYLL